MVDIVCNMNIDRLLLCQVFKHTNDTDRNQWLGSDTKMTPTEANGLGQTQKGTILTNKQLQIYMKTKLYVTKQKTCR